MPGIDEVYSPYFRLMPDSSMSSDVKSFLGYIITRIKEFEIINDECEITYEVYITKDKYVEFCKICYDLSIMHISFDMLYACCDYTGNINDYELHSGCKLDICRDPRSIYCMPTYPVRIKCPRRFKSETINAMGKKLFEEVEDNNMMKCVKCKSTKFFTEKKGNQVGLYCDNCGKWQKWLSKDEVRAYEHKIETSAEDTNNTDMKLYEITYVSGISGHLKTLLAVAKSPENAVEYLNISHEYKPIVREIDAVDDYKIRLEKK